MSEAVSEAALSAGAMLPGEGMGQRLRAAREAAKLSVEDVAAQLRLSARQVSALEAEGFEQLPGRTFVRGFVRNYARLVHLDPEPLLAYAGERLDRPVLQPITEGMGVIPSAQVGAPPWQKWAILAALLAALLAGAAFEWWQHQARTPSSERLGLGLQNSGLPAPATETSGKSASIELPLPPAASNAPPPAGETIPAASSAAAPPTSTPVASPAAPAQSAAKATENSTSSTNLALADATAKPSPPSAPGKAPAASGKLGLSFGDDCWVEVRDRSGQIVLSQNFRAGQQTTVGGQPPFDLVLGNAAAARISFDGRSIDLAPHSRQNVARLRLP